MKKHSPKQRFPSENSSTSYDSSGTYTPSTAISSSSEDDLENPMGELISRIRNNQAGEDFTLTIKINVGDGSLQALGEALVVNDSIKKLSIKNIFRNAAEADQFAPFIAQNNSIKELDLFNNIYMGGEFLGIVLANNPNIQTLNIRATAVNFCNLAKTIKGTGIVNIEFDRYGSYSDGANDLTKSIKENLDLLIKTGNEVAGVLDRDDILPDALKGLILDYVSIKPSTSLHSATARPAMQSSDKSR